MLTDESSLNNLFQMESRRDEDSTLLGPEEGPAAEVMNVSGASDIVFVCEHASNALPESLGDLGLPPEAVESHIAWDPGAYALACRLSVGFDAPLVAGRFSRLVYDCNRPPERADAMPDRSEIYEIPGNRAISEEGRAARVREIYEPFHGALAEVIDERLALGRPVALVTVHTFTPIFFGKPRAVELGILHDEDSRLADACLARAADLTGLAAAQNSPYGPESGVTYTLQRHALPRGLPNVMLEIRNDLVTTAAAQAQIAEVLGRLLAEALAALRAAGIVAVNGHWSGTS